MATENTNFTTRVYKYGVVFDHNVTLNFPDEAVKELRRINDLWNRLVDLNERTNEEIEAKYKKECAEYHQLVMQREEKYRLRKTKEQEFAHTRMIATSISGKNPLISSAEQSIKEIDKQLKPIKNKIKNIRKTLRSELPFEENKRREEREEGKSLVSTKNSLLWRENADQVYRNFNKALKAVWQKRGKGEKANLRFHRFDGTGSWHFDLRQKGKGRDGVK